MNKTTDNFYSHEELHAFGFASVGRNTQISRLVRLYNITGSIGEYVRIDDFSILKGHVIIGSFVHIAAFCLISGVAGVVTMEDFSGLAARVSIYTGSDNYSGDNLTNPTVPAEYRDDIKGDVVIGRGGVLSARIASFCPELISEPLCPVERSVYSGGKLKVARLC